MHANLANFMKQMTFVPVGGLANRIYTINSAISFCKAYNLHLRIIWFKDWGMGAGFHDLFYLSKTIENVEIREADFGDFFKYAKPIKSNFFLPRLYQRFKFDSIYSFWNESDMAIPVEKWYLSQNSHGKFYLLHCQQFYDNGKFFNALHLVDSIQKRIDGQLNLLSAHTIGIHIRRQDLTATIEQSPLPAFIEKMQQEIITNADVNFYVASDSQEEKEKLKDIFGSRIITVENILKRNTKDGIEDALIELYMLASTKKILGSFQSTYSTLASEIKGIPIEIVLKNN
jgi:hypothetical protein